MPSTLCIATFRFGNVTMTDGNPPSACFILRYLFVDVGSSVPPDGGACSFDLAIASLGLIAIIVLTVLYILRLARVQLPIPPKYLAIGVAAVTAFFGVMYLLTFIVTAAGMGKTCSSLTSRIPSRSCSDIWSGVGFWGSGFSGKSLGVLATGVVL
eukprot:jgi/Hompol1/1502/HPOL_003209-RA